MEQQLEKLREDLATETAKVITLEEAAKHDKRAGEATGRELEKICQDLITETAKVVTLEEVAKHLREALAVEKRKVLVLQAPVSSNKGNINMQDEPEDEVQTVLEREPAATHPVDNTSLAFWGL
jgi:sugar diacid utilization regulator